MEFTLVLSLAIDTVLNSGPSHLHGVLALAGKQLHARQLENSSRGHVQCFPCKTVHAYNSWASDLALYGSGYTASKEG